MDPHAWGLGRCERVRIHDIPRSVLALVDERQGGRYCVACRRSGYVTPPEEPLELDHKQPLSMGGDNHHLNLQWLCRSHNRGRCNRREAPVIPAWLRRQRRKRPARKRRT